VRIFTSVFVVCLACVSAAAAGPSPLVPPLTQKLTAASPGAACAPDVALAQIVSSGKRL
jgi:hypothetical protein